MKEFTKNKNDKSKPTPPDSQAQALQLKEALFATLDESKKTRNFYAAQLGTAAGVTDATISFLRSGTKDVRMATFQRLIDAMPLDVALIYYRILGSGLEDAIKQSDTAPLRTITALLPGCDDDELMALAYELGKLSAERQSAGSERVSAFLAISRIVEFCDLQDLPELINCIGKFTAGAVQKSLPVSVKNDT